MSTNLLELLKEHLSGDVVSNLASLIKETPGNTESALKSALPSLLAGLVSQCSDSRSSGNLFNLLTTGNYDGGLLSNLGALSRGGDETNQLLTQGSNILTSLFGDKVSSITDIIANGSGINKTSSSSLLNFITPVSLGLIGKTLKLQHIDSAAGLASLLSSQSDFLTNLLPTGLSNLFGGGAAAGPATASISDFDKAVNSIGADVATAFIHEKATKVSEAVSGFSNTLDDLAEDALSSVKHVAEDIGGSVGAISSHIAEESKEFAHSAAEVFEQNTNKGGKFLPWILIAAALALAWGLLKSCSVPETAQDATATSEAPPTVAAPPVTATPAPPAPVAVEPAKVKPTIVEKATDSDFYEKTLSTGYVIKAAKDGLESKLVTFIESSDAVNKDLWLTMDGIQFDTDKDTIRPESMGQVGHLSEVLKAFPKVKIKIGGYTDNTGNASANKTLSNNRAEAVKKATVAKGVTADRIDAEGYGSDHPVASNDTPEGRQQNRRIDVRVTEK